MISQELRKQVRDYEKRLNLLPLTDEEMEKGYEVYKEVSKNVKPIEDQEQARKLEMILDNASRKLGEYERKPEWRSQASTVGKYVKYILIIISLTSAVFLIFLIFIMLISIFS